MTKLFLIAATMLSAATSPVVARDARPATALSSESAAAKSTPAATQRYCIVQMVTGSRIPIRTCQTRGEWLKDGFDPLAKN